MLSIEKLPLDSHEISHLKSGSDDKVIALQEEVEDLFKSGLDGNAQLPKFSIRDYVFSARCKDVKSSWPFSQKHLQLCLNHGVKDLLPPFQCVDFVKNRSIQRCTADSPLIEKESISSLDGEYSLPLDRPGRKQKLVVDCVNADLSRSEGDKELPSTIKNQSLSDRTPCEAVENITSYSGEQLDITKSERSKTTNHSSSKRYRLIVKVGGGGNPSSNEDTTANSATLPEPMASKVCPVCKTFSSSSNTTLNAHIDQCLSVEATMKWPANSRAVKHRIKPRKTRLMVDVYATSKPCTLEELDRRNGTCWAVNSSLPTQETVERAKEEKKRASPVNFKENDHESPVYIDANGKKVRILSKFSNTFPVAKLGTNPGPQNPFRGRGRKLHSTYKKRHRAQKHSEYLKLAAESRKLCSPRDRHKAEAHGGWKRKFSIEGSEKEKSLILPFKSQHQIKSNDSGTITKWSSCKRTSLFKRFNHGEGLWRRGRYFRKELPVESDQSSLDDSYSERSCVQKPENSSECPLSSPESSKKMENPSFRAIYDCSEHPPMRKRVGLSSFGTQINSKVESVLEPPKRNLKRLWKDSTSVDENCKDFVNYREDYICCPGQRTIKVNDGPVKNGSHDVLKKMARSRRVFSSSATKCSSSRKHMLSARQTSMPKYKLNKKSSAESVFKNSDMHHIEEFNEEVITLPSEVNGKIYFKEKNAENQSRVDEIIGKSCLGGCNLLNIVRDRRAFSVSLEEQFKALKSASESVNDDMSNDTDSSASIGDDLAGTFDALESDKTEIDPHMEGIANGPASEGDTGGIVMNLSKSVESEYDKQSNSFNTLAGALQSLVFKRSLCGAETFSCAADTSVGDEQEMICADEVGINMIFEIRAAAEMDSEDRKGDYFTEVDPIPIPGPPGSFLPSPRHMSSDDLQGNSSLTTSQVQSPEHHHDLVDMDLLNSPISTVSNSTIARSDLKSSEKLSMGFHVTQDDFRSSFYAVIQDAVAENTAPAHLTAASLAERTNISEQKIDRIVTEKGPDNFRNDQPCCCSRKDGTFQSISLNYQDTQLLRRTTASVPLPVMQKQLSVNGRLNKYNTMPGLNHLRNFPSPESEKVALPITKTVGDPASIKVFADTGLKVPVHGFSDSVGPCASNPVLRLMGKDLMVVNKDESLAAREARQAHPFSTNDYPNPQYQTLPEVFPHNPQIHSFNCVVDQHPLFSGQSQCDTGSEIKVANSFGSHFTSAVPPPPSYTASGVLSSKTIGGGRFDIIHGATQIQS
ncbi:uncharacterized protein LOC127811621 isoform X2 [Diospyros lotus]|uniref:uncharacterized protein LOC127811621 isoform X2 n=1 Tax=Diospyros lotus TaxID=55363 RepID=UPI002252E620|nr:uncharacterized protein LOC127811621 isoform X2 [Diospyros lotus]